MRNAVFACLCVLTFAGGASAQAVADDAAKAQFKLGVEAFKAGQYEDAVKAFGEANRLSPTWKLEYNIGQCHALLKRYGLALEAFERYLAGGGDEVPAERQAEVMNEVQRLRAMVGVVEIRGRDGDEVTVNGLVRGILPKASRLKVEMGDVKVEVRRGGAQAVAKEFGISGGETVTVEVPDKVAPLPVAVAPVPVPAPRAEPKPEPKPEPKVEPVPEPAPAPAPQKPAGQGTDWDTAAYVSWGVGGAMIVTAAVLGGLTWSGYSDLEGDCASGVCPSDRKGDADKVKAMGLSADVLGGVGLAAAALGCVFFWALDGEDGVEAGAAPVSGQGAALELRGSF
jgi:hypothetical protein